jgi:hypothetical protein
MDANLDFLSENAQRRFPLDERSHPIGSPGDFEWPDDVLLDARGFCRLETKVGSGLRLLHFSASGSLAPAAFAPAPGGSSFFFGRGAGEEAHDFRVDVPDSLTEFPATRRAVLADPWRGGVCLGALEIVVGEGIRALPPQLSCHFGPDPDDGGAPLEPCCLIDLFGAQVDLLYAIPAAAPGFAAGSAARLRGGYNVDVRSRDGRIDATARVGAGELGAFAGSVAPDACGDALRTLNGVGPDGRGRFFLHAGPGVRIENHPDAHRIDVYFAPESFGAAGCRPV